MNKIALQKFLASVNVPRNTSVRGDCPMCGGNNTLSITNTNGRIKYYCFKNSCDMSGGLNREMSLNDVKAKLINKEPEALLRVDCLGWEANIKAYSKAVEYLHFNNCVAAYEAYPGKFFYDKIKERIIFVEYANHTSFKLATGRSLRNEKPKWYKYAALPGAYYIATAVDHNINSNTIYIVEDCASACAVSRIGHGLALCGTNYDILALVEKVHKLNCSDVVVCLDPDAQLKALKLKQDLQGLGKFRSVKVAQTSDDIKYMGCEQMKKELHYGEVTD